MSVIDVRELVEGMSMAMLQHREEIIPFAEWMIAERINSVIEIGTGPGGTTAVLGTICEGPIVSIDVPGDQTTNVHNRLQRRMRNFHGVQGDSGTPETLTRVDALLNHQSVDLLFIDGDHRYEKVKRDFELYAYLVRSGGWIALHDINASDKWPDMGVPKFWKELKIAKKTWIATPHSDDPPSWGGIGVVRK